MDNKQKNQFVPSGSESSHDRAYAVRELTPDDLEQVNGAGYSNDPDNKRRKLEEGKE